MSQNAGNFEKEATHPLQFGLRGLLAFVTIVCGILGCASYFGFALVFRYVLLTAVLLVSVVAATACFLFLFQIPVIWICSKLAANDDEDESGTFSK